MAGGEFTNHFNAIRFRIVGSGLMDLQLISLDEVYTNTLTSISMATAPGRFKTQLANFTQQKAQLSASITGLGNYFQINEIIIYTKPVATSYPQ